LTRVKRKYAFVSHATYILYSHNKAPKSELSIYHSPPFEIQDQFGKFIYCRHIMIRTLNRLSMIVTIFELILSITLLSLFASAYPDRFRTSLWRDGGSKGWNSDPHQRVYFYANYREAPPIPMIWDERFQSRWPLPQQMHRVLIP
jgi:hypothetical protein